MSNSHMLELILQHAVQVSALALVVWLVTSRFTKQRPHLAHLLWALVLLKCLTPPVIPSPASPFSWLAGWSSSKKLAAERLSVEFTEKLPQTNLQSESTPIQNLPAQDSTLANAALNRSNEADAQSNNKLYALALWLAFQMKQHPFAFTWFGSSLFVAMLTLLKFARFLMRLRSLANGPSAEATFLSEQLQPITTRLAKRLRIRRSVRIQVTDALLGPAILGLLRPTILLPRLIAEDASPKQLEALIGHELVHLRRGDLWWSTIQALATCFTWWNPLAWLAARQFQQETERCCDEETVASLGIEPATYARVLVGVLEKKSTLEAAPLLPGVRPVEITAKRLERIMRFGQGCRSRSPRWATPFLLLGCCIVLPGAALSVAQESAALPKPIRPMPPMQSGPAHNLRPAKPLTYASEKVETSLDLSFLNGVDLQVQRYQIAKILELIVNSEQVTKEEATQLLLESLPLSVQPPANPGGVDLRFNAMDETTGQSFALGGGEPKFKVVGGNLFVLASKATHGEIAKELAHINQFGVSMLSLSVQILELPTKTMDELAVNWTPKNLATPEVIPASFESQTTESPASRKAMLDRSAHENLLKAARVLSAPRIVLANGKVGSLTVGSKHPFVTGVEIIEGESGEKAAQPKITVLDAGVDVEFVGTIQPDGTVQLDVKYKQSEIGEVNVFTYELDGQEVSVQQPSFSQTAFALTQAIPQETPFAISCNTKTREYRKETKVPLIGDLPYVNKLFKNVAIGRERVSTIMVVECKKMKRMEASQPNPSTPTVPQVQQTRSREWYQPNSSAIEGSSQGTNPLAAPAPANAKPIPHEVTSDLGIRGQLHLPLKTLPRVTVGPSENAR